MAGKQRTVLVRQQVWGQHLQTQGTWRAQAQPCLGAGRGPLPALQGAQACGSQAWEVWERACLLLPSGGPSYARVTPW